MLYDFILALYEHEQHKVGEKKKEKKKSTSLTP